MTKRKDSVTGFQHSDTNNEPEPDDDPAKGLGPDYALGQGEGGESKSKSDERVYKCIIGTPNAIIGTKKYAVGDEVDGGLTAHDIRKHRRAGVAIHCDELDHPEHGNSEHAKTV